MSGWTWPGHEGQSLAVRVFARCDSGQVALTLNGKAVAKSPAACSYVSVQRRNFRMFFSESFHAVCRLKSPLHSQSTEFMAGFDVPYAAGKLSAACVGNATATKTFTTAKVHHRCT